MQTWGEHAKLCTESNLSPGLNIISVVTEYKVRPFNFFFRQPMDSIYQDNVSEQEGEKSFIQCGAHIEPSLYYSRQAIL